MTEHIDATVTSVGPAMDEGFVMVWSESEYPHTHHFQSKLPKNDAPVGGDTMHYVLEPVFGSQPLAVLRGFTRCGP